jgi:hypothetical protein
MPDEGRGIACEAVCKQGVTGGSPVERPTEDPPPREICLAEIAAPGLPLDRGGVSTLQATKQNGVGLETRRTSAQGLRPFLGYEVVLPATRYGSGWQFQLRELHACSYPQPTWRVRYPPPDVAASAEGCTTCSWRPLEASFCLWTDGWGLNPPRNTSPTSTALSTRPLPNCDAIWCRSLRQSGPCSTLSAVVALGASVEFGPGGTANTTDDDTVSASDC